MKSIDRLANNSLVSEKALERYVVEQAEKRGWKALKYANPNEAGYPDRLIVMPHGFVAWCEVKSAECKPRKLQQIRHEELRNLCHETYVVSSREQIDDMYSYCDKILHD